MIELAAFIREEAEQRAADERALLFLFFSFPRKSFTVSAQDIYI